MVKRKLACADEAPEVVPNSTPHDLASTREQGALDILPGITRKLTACGARRKQKIKCDMTNGPPFTRCRRRGLSCISNKSLQSLVEEVKHTELLQSDVRAIHESLEAICQHLGLPQPKPLVSKSESLRKEEKSDQNEDLEQDQERLDGCEISPPDTPSAVQAPIDTFLDIAKLGSPESSANTPPSTTRPRSHPVQDLISKHVISESVAQALLDRYLVCLDPYLYGICGAYRSLQQTTYVARVICSHMHGLCIAGS
ncbi:hypothetical protein N7492_007349 [Penicillium capsulatum]|uniref:Zn(2)-C6 fungal-type domain-containing protein n=1 Tax=Penicillium capsulatum TaxID=69766 RepID=A0A9W9LKR3_9EURO|nr:hypothetical protein N7492_007349 [Penicillium capsulatum]KAJ6117189.1 hypothetical protein N7512_006914 [Penicillium capsulatum]